MTTSEPTDKASFLSGLKPGDWINMEYGDRHDFYVADVRADWLKLGNPNWLNSSSKWMPVSEVEGRQPLFLGSGKPRLLSKIPWFGDAFFPPFTRPK